MSTTIKFTQDRLIIKTNTIQIIQKYKKNLFKFPGANLPITE